MDRIIGGKEMIAKIIMKCVQLIFKPVVAGKITGTELKKLFTTKNIFISDKAYTLARHEDIEKFLKLNIFKLRQYVPEKYDCDNYAFSLMGMFTNLMSGYAIGIVWVKTPKGGHALNFFVDGSNEVWYIEPQSNKIFKNKTYKPFLVVM